MRLQALLSNGRLAHGWLLTGKSGIGKLEFALHLTRYLLCRQKDQHGPCGGCQECHLFAAGTHPDVKLLQPSSYEPVWPNEEIDKKEAKSRQVKIEQVREAIEFAQGTAQRGGAKIILLRPAEAMNNNTANALLKILEEPPPLTYLFLISEQPSLLLPTLRSRSQLLEFRSPPQSDALAWLHKQSPGAENDLYLQLAQGAPLHALRLMKDQAVIGFSQLLQALESLLQNDLTPVQAARKCDDLGMLRTIDYQLLAIGKMLPALQSGETVGLAQLKALCDLCLGLPRTLMLRRLHGYHATLIKARRIALASNNANPQLVLESLFAEWAQLLQQRNARSA